jgi:5'-nucleotidase
MSPSNELPQLVDPGQPYVLLTNDDGIDSPALLALAQEVAKVAQVAVIAPEHNWSAAGHTKTMHKPLRVASARLPNGQTALAASGSPSDCVALALLGLLGAPPALVISGVNVGCNVGHDLTYSGTVSAAMEAVIGGVPAMAVSLDSYEPADPTLAAHFAAKLVPQMLAQSWPIPLLLNINVPARPTEQVRGARITRLGQRLYRDALVQRHDPRGRSYYWIGGDPPSGVPEPGTDIGALAEGYISITPIRLDMTDVAAMDALQSWNLELPQ